MNWVQSGTPNTPWWGAPKVIRFLTGIGHIWARPLGHGPSHGEPDEEAALADADGVVAVGHEGVGQQLVTHPGYLQEMRATHLVHAGHQHSVDAVYNLRLSDGHIEDMHVRQALPVSMVGLGWDLTL